jgi:CheY-like chemotaxis protein
MPHSRKILLVDPDPASARALGPPLRRLGYKVHAVRDGSRGLQLAILRSPDLILLDERAPLVDPRTFVRILRANPRTERIPVVILSASPEPGRAHLGLHLSKPLAEEDVLARVEQVLRRTGASRAPSVPGAELQGNLARLAAPDLLQVLALNRKTGRLEVEREGVHAAVTFRGGRIVDAVAGTASGEKALFRILTLREGRFAFVPGDQGTPERIERGLEELLLDGLRQSDEAAVLTQALPASGERVLLAVRPDEIPPGQGPVASEVVSLLATPRTLQELLDRAPWHDLEVMRAVAALLERGHARLEPRAPGAEEPAFLEVDALHALRMRLGRNRPPGSARVGKVLIAGGPPARRAMMERLASVLRFQATDGEEVEMGTLCRLALGEGVQVDVVALPEDRTLAPVWWPLAAGGLAALVLLPVGGLDRELAALSASCRLPWGACGAREVEIPSALREVPHGCRFLGSDPAEALRSLLVAAAAVRPGRGEAR